MNFTLILISTIVATSAMTAFSYFYSSIANKQFREPELLNILLRRLPGGIINLTKTSLIGWIIHYLVGLAFMVLFFVIWEKAVIDPSWISGLILGFLAGIIGVIGWQLTFLVHPNPPELKFKHYYIHLILAHIIFGLCGSAIFNYWN